MITGINESKTLTKHISCECKCKFDGKNHICEKNYIWNPATCSCENDKYLASIIDDSLITHDEMIDANAEAKSYDEETKTIPKNIIYQTKSFYILLAFLLIAIALWIAVTIYCYLIKYKAKQKSTYYHFTSQMTNSKKFRTNNML